ncbi:hypothetical protein [Sagittula stellata]|uniref:Uncharacterized protein n=1 Tax=Sagittula stellata (strain ATCC 700073 / DSM 11524 / E-37) TaxID=388399 RepID=A3K6M1_SAGS3|nr:hypothetical protein [Sagittula stellata]EBA06998.1 hypothetical protein SSE37_12411 [Sagittula stellata E-37]
MDDESLKKLQAELGARPSGGTERMILQTVRPTRSRGGPSPAPEAYPDRTAYRKALIDFEDGQGAPDLDALVGKLQALGLKTSVARGVQAVVVEGAPEALSRALEAEEVEDAEFDRAVDMVRPRRPSKE